MNPTKTSFQPKFDNLEDRCVPAGITLSPQGLLHIDGTVDRSQQARVAYSPGGRVTATLNVYNMGRTQTYSAVYNQNWVKAIRFDGGNMTDWFYNNTNIPSRAVGYGGMDELVGGGGADNLYGGNGFDQLDGRSGSDYLDGGNDRDIIRGGYGNDRLIGGFGADELYGEQDTDMLIGGTYNASTDTFTNDGSADVMYGGSGADLFFGEWFAIYYNRDNPSDFSQSGGDYMLNGPLW